MTNHISVESLSVISHDSIPVVTTELLANLYGTDVDNIKKNFTRNAIRFTEGKHYFKLTGDELRSFKHKVTICPLVKIAGNVRHLMLWTERGAARHAKMLETDQAWEVFEKLEDCYFSHKGGNLVSPACSYDSRAVAYLKSGSVVSMYPLADDQIVMTLDSMMQILEKQGWTLFRKEDLLVKLAEALTP